MKKILITFLTLLILSPIFDRFGLIAYYYLNTDYIVEFLCINKEKPESKCNGKCYLNSELKQDQENKKDLPLSINEIKDAQFVVEIIKFLSNQEAPINSSTSSFLCMSDYSQEFHKDIFRPPIT